MPSSSIRVTDVSKHVVQMAVPTPTLPPSFETNTYLIRHGNTGILVDAGTRDEALLEELTQLVAAQGVTSVTAILATHYHRDHTQGIPFLHTHYQAPVYVHEKDLAQALGEMGEAPPRVEPMLDRYAVGPLHVNVEHRPGHTRGHVHILVREDSVILVGDHLAGDGSVWIGPPDGHMATYFTSLDAIAASGCQIAAPGHGNVLTDAAQAAVTIRQRRQAREREIEQLVKSEPRTVDFIVERLYRGVVPAEAMWVATKTVQAHLEHLLERGRVIQRVDAEGGYVYFTQ